MEDLQGTIHSYCGTRFKGHEELHQDCCGFSVQRLVSKSILVTFDASDRLLAIAIMATSTEPEKYEVLETIGKYSEFAP